MTSKQLTLWEAIDGLAKQIPWTKDRVGSLLSATLFETDNPGNDVFRFYKSAPVTLADGIVISNVDLRVKRDGTHPGFLVLSVGGACVTLEGVRQHYANLKITGVPRGRSLDEETQHTADLPWGNLSFGFAERNPSCLSSISLDPKKSP